MEVEVSPEHEQFLQIVKGEEIGIITRSMVLIKCKHVEHAIQKELQDPPTHMVHVA
jgi:hypothetical protein